MSERKKFHPIVLLIYFFQGIRSWFFLLFLIFVSSDGETAYRIVALSAVLILITATAFTKYFTQTYQISSEKIVVYRGIFQKRETDISYDRIQTVKQRQWFFFKPFRVVQVLIETGSGTGEEAEASLPAVNESVLESIERNRQKTNWVEESDQSISNEEKTQYRLTNQLLLLYSLTDLTIVLIFFPVFTFILDWAPDSWLSGVDGYFAGSGWGIIVGLAAAGLLILMILSIIKNFIQYYTFTVTFDQDTLTIEYGLFERKLQKIPLAKIQGIKVHQQIFRKLLGMSSVEMILIGGQEKNGESSAINKLFLFPLISTKEVYASLTQFVPDLKIEQPSIIPVSQGKLWYFWRWLLLLVVPATGIGWYFFDWLGVTLLFVTLLLLVMQWLDCRQQGYAVQENDVICIQSFSGFSTVQTFLEQSRIQSFTKSSTKWLLNKHIGHVKFWIKEGNAPKDVGLRFVHTEDIETIQNRFRALHVTKSRKENNGDLHCDPYSQT